MMPWFYPYAFPVSGATNPQSSIPSGCCSYPVWMPPAFYPWRMGSYGPYPWMMPQAMPQASAYGYPATPMMPQGWPGYQVKQEHEKRVWDSPQSPQSPWLKTYQQEGNDKN